MAQHEQDPDSQNADRTPKVEAGDGFRGALPVAKQALRDFVALRGLYGLGDKDGKKLTHLDTLLGRRLVTWYKMDAALTDEASEDEDRFGASVKTLVLADRFEHLTGQVMLARIEPPTVETAQLYLPFSKLSISTKYEIDPHEYSPDLAAVTVTDGFSQPFIGLKITYEPRAGNVDVATGDHTEDATVRFASVEIIVPHADPRMAAIMTESLRNANKNMEFREEYKRQTGQDYVSQIPPYHDIAAWSSDVSGGRVASIGRLKFDVPTLDPAQPHLVRVGGPDIFMYLELGSQRTSNGDRVMSVVITNRADFDMNDAEQMKAAKLTFNLPYSISYKQS